MNAEIYRVAHDAAGAELIEISAEFERLRVRKEQIERLILALRPLVGEEETATATSTDNAAPDKSEPKSEAAKEETPQPLGVSADPFQRRIDHVLGIGAGIRDVRQYTRQF
jgi:hypothetical protein